MQVILSDHNCEGHVDAIFQAVRHEGLLSLAPMQLRFFSDVGLHPKASDREVWNFCQKHSYLLLTGNRTASDGKKSLEYIISAFVQEESLPVITIGNLGRVMADPNYCRQCAENLAEIVLGIDALRGVSRLYIPSRAVSR